MAAIPTISLEQWRALVAVVDDEGYAAAAEAIHKSQSTVTYAVQQIEKLLGVKAFRLEGRKAVLTPAGRMLYSRARVLLDEASSLERAAQRNSAGWEAEITIAVEIIFPTWLLLKCLDPLRTRGAEYTHRGDRDGARRRARGAARAQRGPRPDAACPAGVQR